MLARSATSTRPPTRLLLPPTVPHHPWSHISLDLATGLLPSQGHTAILTDVDWLSKMAHLIPLPRLRSVNKTAELVFCLHGRPVETVADQGLQFSVLEGILHPHGALASPSSGPTFHISKAKLVWESPLIPALLINGGPIYMVRHLCHS